MVAPGSSKTLADIRRMGTTENRIAITIVITHRSAYDPDNLIGSVKVCLDAMKNLRFFRDDNGENITLKVEQVVAQNREPQTMITLEEICD